MTAVYQFYVYLIKVIVIVYLVYKCNCLVPLFSIRIKLSKKIYKLF